MRNRRIFEINEWTDIYVHVHDVWMFEMNDIVWSGLNVAISYLKWMYEVWTKARINEANEIVCEMHVESIVKIKEIKYYLFSL